jgi:hypothetical protein
VNDSIIIIIRGVLLVQVQVVAEVLSLLLLLNQNNPVSTRITNSHTKSIVVDTSNTSATNAATSNTSSSQHPPLVEGRPPLAQRRISGTGSTLLPLVSSTSRQPNSFSKSNTRNDNDTFPHVFMNMDSLELSPEPEVSILLFNPYYVDAIGVVTSQQYEL